MSNLSKRAAHRLAHDLTDMQRRWSSAKLRHVMRDKRYAIASRNFFYAELLRRRHRHACQQEPGR